MDDFISAKDIVSFLTNLLSLFKLKPKNEIFPKQTELTKDEETGKLIWKFDLEPGVLKAFELSYIIKYPKKRKVETRQKYRTISCPSF